MDRPRVRCHRPRRWEKTDNFVFGKTYRWSERRTVSPRTRHKYAFQVDVSEGDRIRLVFLGTGGPSWSHPKFLAAGRAGKPRSSELPPSTVRWKGKDDPAPWFGPPRTEGCLGWTETRGGQCESRHVLEFSVFRSGSPPTTHPLGREEGLVVLLGDP